MQDLRFGVIGAGMIAGHACTAINAHPHAYVHACWDPHAQRLAAQCDAHSIPVRHDSAEALLNDPDVDAVYVAVPNKFHAGYNLDALRAGKHLLAEKPFAMNLAEAQTIANEARARPEQVFMVGMNQRFNADSQKARDLVQRGVLGDVYHAKAYWTRREGIPRLGTWFGHKDLAGGGCLLDIGVHMLDLALYTLGRFDPVAVTGMTYSKFGPRGLGQGGWGSSTPEGLAFDVDDLATALIRFADGLTLQLDISWARHQAEPDRHDVQLFGTDAGVSLFPCRLYHRGNPLRDGYEVIDDVQAAVPMPHAERFHHFIQVIRGEETLCITLDETLAVQRILDAIYQSAATGREVRLDV